MITKCKNNKIFSAGSLGSYFTKLLKKTRLLQSGKSGESRAALLGTLSLGTYREPLIFFNILVSTCHSTRIFTKIKQSSGWTWVGNKFPLISEKKKKHDRPQNL